MSDTAVILGGPSPEHDVSILTGLQAARELATGGQRSIRALYWTKSGEWFEVDPSLEAEAFLTGVPTGASPLQLVLGSGGGFRLEGGRFGRPRTLDLEAALVCCHGGPGEDGTLQGALDLIGLPYSGPTVAGAALGMDKLAFAGVVAAIGLPLLPRSLLRAIPGEVGFDGPYIVKPRFGGSSIGIDVVPDLSTARARLDANLHLRQGAVIEPYRGDLFDLQVAVRSWPQLGVSAVERPLRPEAGAGIPGAGEILGYADKYVGGQGMASAPRQLPAEIPGELTAGLREAAAAVAHSCSVRGVARVDFLSDGRDFWVNEVNTIPGSLAKYLWIDPVVPFGRLLSDLLGEALGSPSHAYSAAGADGAVLRSAASIAAKLA